MKILSLKDISLRQTDQVYRASALGSAVATLLMIGLVATAEYLLTEGHIGKFSPPIVIVIGLGLFFLMFRWLVGTIWKAARRPTNWVLRIRGNEILIKFRSYKNWRMDENDPQVIQLQRSEIAFVRIFKNTRFSTSGDMDRATRIDRQVDLEIGLKNVEVSLLQQAIADERGNDHHRTKFLDYPVEVTADSIRINWRGASAVIRPGIKHVMNELGRLTQTEQTQSTIEDFTPRALKNLDEAQQRRRLVELSVRDPISATHAVKALHRCSLSEASRLIEEWTAAGAIA
jgi:hypothetical protein